MYTNIISMNYLMVVHTHVAQASGNKCDIRLSHAHLRGGCVNCYHAAGLWLLAIGVKSLTPSLLQSQESSRPGLRAIKARPS